MKRILIVSLVVLGVAAVGLAAEDASLVQTLASQLNVTPDQAAGGAGAIFNYAKTSLPSNEYAKVEGAVPESAELVKKAPATDSTASAAAGMLGKTAGSAAGVASLGSSFEKLGLSSDMVGKFVPVVVDYVDKKGGSEVGGILKKVLVPESK
ncbi:MAG TPA: DUF2780 domain-containing protein [Thermoanaerobaculia bacterium]|jgi:hypothetical protein|nr:DUF2780 domain-containing protein [Thermoanaerobaculia bacterium]